MKPSVAYGKFRVAKMSQCYRKGIFGFLEFLGCDDSPHGNDFRILVRHFNTDGSGSADRSVFKFDLFVFAVVEFVPLLGVIDRAESPDVRDFRFFHIDFCDSIVFLERCKGELTVGRIRNVFRFYVLQISPGCQGKMCE